MATLTDREQELVALGASIGAGCRPCTKYHVATALKTGLPTGEVHRAIDGAQAVRCDAAALVANVGRGGLGVEGDGGYSHRQPADREQLLVCVGAAAGSNAAPLVKAYVEDAGQRFGLSGEELREALDIAETVKEHAADFFRRDVAKLAPVAATASTTGASCGCQPQAPATVTPAAEEAGTSCGCQPTATATAAEAEGTGAGCGCQTQGDQS